MAYNVTLRTKSIGGQVNVLGSTQVRHVTGGVTIDQATVRADANGGKRLRAGEFLGRITATGLYAPVRRSALAALATAPVAASLTTALAGDNNDLTYTALVPGTAGNGIAVQYIDPAGNDKPLAVNVVGSAILVSLATGPAGAITSTAGDIATEIAATPAAAALVSAGNAAGNDGTGVVTAMTLTALTLGADNDLNTITLNGAVMGGAAYFQAGDLITIGADNYAIATADAATGVVTLTTNLINNYAIATAVQVADGSDTALLVLAEDVDFELDGSGRFGNQVATAWDWARLLTARLPRTPDLLTRQQLSGITFS